MARLKASPIFGPSVLDNAAFAGPDPYDFGTAVFGACGDAPRPPFLLDDQFTGALYALNSACAALPCPHARQKGGQWRARVQMPSCFPAIDLRTTQPCPSLLPIIMTSRLGR